MDPQGWPRRPPEPANSQIHLGAADQGRVNCWFLSQEKWVKIRITYIHLWRFRPVRCYSFRFQEELTIPVAHPRSSSITSFLSSGARTMSLLFAPEFSRPSLHRAKRWPHALLMLAACFLLCLGAFAQGADQGTVSGITSDPSGAVLPGSSLTLTNTATGETFNATSNGAGLFIFPVLPVGTYKLQATHTGFSNLEANNIKVTVGSKIDLPLTLGVASGKETVEVSAEAPVVETTRTSVSDTVNDREIQTLPTNGRNFLDFTLLTPGVVRDVRSGDLSFAGQRGTLNSLTVDGTDNNNSFFGQTLGRTGSGRAPYQFSEDAVQEFQVNS